MWLHIPKSTDSPYAPASAGSILPSLSPWENGTLLGCSWRGKPLPLRYWRRVCRTAPFLKLLSGLTCSRSMADRGAAAFRSSLRVYPVSPTQLPESNSDTKTSEQSGQRQCESSEKCSPPWSSSKTSQTSFSFFESPERSYQEWATGLRQEYSARRRLGRRIGENGCSSWPTPHGMAGNDYSGKDSGGGEFAKTVEMWPTPDANPEAPNSGTNRGKDYGGARRRLTVQGLGNRAKDWPTPDASVGSGYNQSDSPGAAQRPLLSRAASLWPTPRSEDSESCGNHPGATDSLTGATRLWGTPRVATNGMIGNHREDGDKGRLEDQAAMWSTPAAHDGRRAGSDETSTQGRNLKRETERWPTPGANDHKGTAKLGQRRRQLDEAAEQKWQTPSVADTTDRHLSRSGNRSKELLLRGQSKALASSLQAPETSTSGEQSSVSTPTSPRRLNPAFVTWLMGLPRGWTSFEPLEMESWRSAARWHLSRLLENLD